MNPENGGQGRSGFSGPGGVAGGGGSASLRVRRRFRPAVPGLEGRQLMAASALSTVASFGSSQQAVVGGLAMDGQGNLYGTTSAGGDGGGKGDGSVFEIPHGSNKVTTLATFDGPNGYGLNDVVVDGQGNLFGSMTESGVGHADGRVFEIPHGTKQVTLLAQFDGTHGEFPSGLTMDPQGNLYGTTSVGYAVGGASAFEVARGSGTVTTLASFDNAGSAPDGLITDSRGNLFGTNANGGPNAASTVYEIPRGSGTITTLASFGADSTGISHPTLDGQGNLYGTTIGGGPLAAGTVYEVATGSNAFAPIATFNNTNGAFPNPDVGLVMDGQGNLYGVTDRGGASNQGTVFEVAQGSGTVTTLASLSKFKGSMVSDLMLDGQGNLYGTTDGGGKNGGGTVFKLTLNPPPTST